MKKTTLLFVFLAAVCGYAEYTFDNDKDIQEREDKRDAERAEARKALERMRFGVKAGGAVHASDGSDETVEGEVGIMLNFPLSPLKNGNLLLATELNFGLSAGGYDEISRNGSHYGIGYYEEYHLNIPLMVQYVSFFFPVSDIKSHLLPSPKRHVLMHLKTIAEAGAFIYIPLKSKFRDYDRNHDDRYYDDEGRNFFDPGVMVGGAILFENVIFGIRVAASYTDFRGSSSLSFQGKGYVGWLF